MSAVSDGMWAGRRCFIIGGGPSFRDFDFSILKDELTVGVNMGFLANPTVNLIYDLRLMERLTVDTRWAEYQGAKLWLNSETPNDRNRFASFGVRELYDAVDPYSSQAFWSKSLASGIYRGNNAGIAALNLAEILGADPIYLMGFDFKGVNGRTTNWHSEYDQKWIQDAAVYRSFVDNFVRMKGSVRGRVINLNSDSALRCFEFGNVEVSGEGGHHKIEVKEAESALGILVPAPDGLGDNIYMRPAIRKLVERHKIVYVRTSWPQLYWDIPGARPVKPAQLSFRTQQFNVQNMASSAWRATPSELPEIGGFYTIQHFRLGMGIVPAFLEQFKVTDPIDFSLKVNPAWEPEWVQHLPRPFGVVHPPSVRTEWYNTARNPDMKYLQAVIDARPDIHWVSIGFNTPDYEWFDGPPLHGIARRFDCGELAMDQVLALVARADLAVSAPCWMLPAAAALGTPHFCVFGGSIPPQLLIDPRMGGRTAYVTPAPFCACFLNEHGCNKHIDMGLLLQEFGRFTAGLKERMLA